MPYAGVVSRAVAESVKVVKDGDRPRAAAAIALARRYGTLIDDAAPAARYGKHLTGLSRALDMLGQFEPLAAREATEHLDKITEALAAHSVASDLGPKLLAALTALGLTATAKSSTEGGNPGVSRVVSTVDRLREQRQRRAERAGQHRT